MGFQIFFSQPYLQFSCNKHKIPYYLGVIKQLRLTTYPEPPRVDNSEHFTNYLPFVYMTKHGFSTDHLPNLPLLVHLVIACTLTRLLSSLYKGAGFFNPTRLFGTSEFRQAYLGNLN